MAFEEKMMPGQKPYTDEERAKRDELVAGAARAEEIFTSDELEQHAKQLRAEKGWDVFNDPMIDGAGNLWFEVERDDEAALYANDEEAAREHFHQVQVDNRIWAREPKTEAGKAKVRAYLEALERELMARRAMEDAHSTKGEPESGTVEEQEASMVRALDHAARAARLSGALGSEEGRAKIGAALWAQVAAAREAQAARDSHPFRPLFQAYEALTGEERAEILAGRILYPEELLIRAPAEFQRRTAICEWLFEHVANERLVRVGGDVICEKCKKPYREHVEIHSTFVLLCDGRVGKT